MSEQLVYKARSEYRLAHVLRLERAGRVSYHVETFGLTVCGWDQLTWKRFTDQVQAIEYASRSAASIGGD